MFRRLAYAVGFVVLAWWIAIILVSIFSCTPVRGYWDRTIPATCIDSRAFYLSNSIANIITDVIIIGLALWMVWHLHTTRGQKAALSFIFGLGGFVVIVSSIRVYYIIQVGPDFTWEYTNPIIWSDIETSIAVICACLPILRPVFTNGFSFLSSIWHKSESSDSESAHELRNKPPEASYTASPRATKRGNHFGNLDDVQDVESIVTA